MLGCAIAAFGFVRQIKNHPILRGDFREAPFNLSPPPCGHCPFGGGGGGLNPCPDGLGHFFREEFSKFKWAFASFLGGLNPCQDGLGHLCSEN